MATRTTTIRTICIESVVSGDESSSSFYSAQLNFEEVFFAYLDCRKNKRKSLYAVDFEFELEKNLFQLYEDIL